VALLAGPVWAQSVPATETPAADAPETAAPAPTPAGGDIVVTGTRIRSGFSAPTPVSTASAEQLRTAAPTNVADALNQLPVFNGSTKTSQGTNTNNGGTTGQNLLNLRGLGANRTLVLFNGRRMPTTNASGSVDVNILPQELVQRVDVVTGGASAAYGSDAISGVVNFVLDTKFTGLKLEAQTGVSTHADMPLGGGSLAWGMISPMGAAMSSAACNISIRTASASISPPGATGSTTMPGA
jgi:outer membrane receptor for ferrienterochelin and colicin